MLCSLFSFPFFFSLFFLKQKTAYEMRISDWSSDVCSSDLPNPRLAQHALAQRFERGLGGLDVGDFVAHMMLPARRVLFEEARDRGVAGQRLDQFDLGASAFRLP